MADVDNFPAVLNYIKPENAIRDSGTAWTEGLGLVRSDSANPFKMAVNTVNGGRIAGVIPADLFEAQDDGARASTLQFGRQLVALENSTTTAMNSELACNATGYFRLAVAGDYVVAKALGVASGTGQLVSAQVFPECAQYVFGMPTIEMPANITMSAASAASNVCEVTYTVVDEAGTAIAAVHHFIAYLSDAATGAGETATSASGTVQAKSASGADIAVHTAKKTTLVQTLADGTYILEITDSAKTAFYPCAVHPVTGRAIVGTVLATADYGA